MKIAIVTWAVNTTNYGSILQAFALQNYLKDNGYNSIIIDYSSKIGDFQWPNTLEIFRKKIVRKAKKLLEGNDDNDWESELNETCELFRSHEMNISKKYKGVNDLKNILGLFDVFICGSDQIWSMNKWINSVYYLTWVPNYKGKIAYAPSIPCGITSGKKKKLLKSNTKGFDAISVREEKAAREVSQIINKNVISTLDPTFLVEDSFWNSIVKKNDIVEKYILCYFLGENKKYRECVEQVRKKTGYNVKVIPFNKQSRSIFGEIEYGVGPERFLELIRNAEIILTDSYHASIFSIVFEKRFVLFKRFIDGEKNDENGRIYDLVDKLNLHNQLFDPEIFKYSKIDTPNYKTVKELLQKLRTESRLFLLNGLKRCEENGK